MSYLAWCNTAIPGQSWTGSRKKTLCQGERQSTRARIVKHLAQLKKRMQATTWRFILEGVAETGGRTKGK